MIGLGYSTGRTGAPIQRSSARLWTEHGDWPLWRRNWAGPTDWPSTTTVSGFTGPTPSWIASKRPIWAGATASSSSRAPRTRSDWLNWAHSFTGPTGGANPSSGSIRPLANSAPSSVRASRGSWRSALWRATSSSARIRASGVTATAHTSASSAPLPSCVPVLIYPIQTILAQSVSWFLPHFVSISSPYHLHITYISPPYHLHSIWLLQSTNIVAIGCLQTHNLHETR